MHKPPQHILTVFEEATCIHTSSAVQSALDRMAEEIDQSLAEQNPILLCAMVGGLVTTGQLLPRLDFPLQLDYIHATRYRDNTQGGHLEWVTMPRISLKNRVILVIDDILDGGITLAEANAYCKTQGASEIYSAVLVDKQRQRPSEGLQNADFTGVTVPDKYVFGCGMDYKGYLRNAPGIYAVKNL
jgi:hypoxanthine phosphoribosyltransferase